MKKGKKTKARLEIRRHDFYRMKDDSSHELKISGRIASKGYHCPGSNKK